MKHHFATASLLCAFVLVSAHAFGQVSILQTTPAPGDDETKPQTIRMSVDPAAEPVPALKYALLPTSAERKPGNGVPYYYRALLAFKFQERLFVAQSGKELSLALHEWISLPLKDLPRDEVRSVINQLSSAYEDMQISAFCERCDWGWQLRELNGADVINFRLEEIQESRNLARLLAVKSRLEIAEGRYDDALATLQVGYQLGQDIGRPPILICTLVGISINAILDEQAHELMAAPHSPNLYWAFTALPRPLIDIGPALEYELAFPVRIFPFLEHPETAQHSPQQWAQSISDAVQALQDQFAESAEASPIQNQIVATGMALKGYSRAKRELIAAGYDAAQVEQMAVGQVIAVYEARLCRQIADDLRKWTLVAYPEAEERFNSTIDALRRPEGTNHLSFDQEIVPIANTLFPATRQANEAILRRDISIAADRVIEAIRMHAAANNGKLPKSLSDITIVPVPKHPRFGEDFPYRLEGTTATLEVRRSSLAGQPFQQVDQIFEITIRKQN